MATAVRRIGAEQSATRSAILAAAEAVIREEGHASASTRRVALRGGFKPSLVHYYFPTTDDLLLAVFERGAAQSDAMIATALAGPKPLRALWEFFADTSRTALSVEFIALAIHRPAIRERIAAHSEAMRARQAAALEAALGRAAAPAGLSLVLAGVGRALMMESALGIQGGHAEARAWVEDLIARLEP